MTSIDTKQKANRLVDATSPYLLQHAYNPVNWYEWGEEALKKATQDDKPIFLSIGYSACHWCHVMEHESFESDEVARVLNEHFVSIKVDREERPDIDDIYMAYTQAANDGRGGWPMSVFLRPDGTPFHAGTYYPRDRFLDLLTTIVRLWRDERQQIEQHADAATAYLQRWASDTATAEGVIPQAEVAQTALVLTRYFDMDHGGIGTSGNKFPPSMSMELMLRVNRRSEHQPLLQAVRVTLDNMARGGIYDHLGGGICRYSTDPEWLVPHFEKMLYDQAMVSSIYVDAYQVTKEPLYGYIAQDIFDYVIGDLQSPEGGFYSTRDADSEGMEGKFYIWTVAQVEEVLGEEDAKRFNAYYDVTPRGNWIERFGHAPPGPKNILRIQTPPEEFARQNSLSLSEFNRKLEEWREKMLSARSQRVEPGLDDKVLSGWNGLMITAMAKGARAFEKPEYAEAAARAAEFVLTKMRKDGRLLRTYRNGEARLTGYLDDYAFMIEGLLYLYEATFDQRWLDEAAGLNESLIEHYHDKAGGAFFFTAHDAEQLVARSKSPRDGAIPSGNAVQASNLVKLSILLNRKDLRAKAEEILRVFAADAIESPFAFERLLCAADLYYGPVREIVIVGAPSDETTRAMIQTVYDRYVPNKVVLHSSELTKKSPYVLLEGKGKRDGKPTAYVCENYTCKAPTTDPKVLAEQLATR